MVKCSAPECKLQVRFQFPKQEELKKKWLEFIGKPDLVVKNVRYGLCELHFRDDQIKLESAETGLKLQYMRLKKNTIPSILYPNDSKTLNERRNNITDSCDSDSDDSVYNVVREETHCRKRRCYSNKTKKKITMNKSDEKSNCLINSGTVIKEEIDTTPLELDEIKIKCEAKTGDCDNQYE